MGFFADVGRANVPQRIGAALSNVAAIEDIKMARMKQEQMQYEMEKIDVTISPFNQKLSEGGKHLGMSYVNFLKKMGLDPHNISRGDANKYRFVWFQNIDKFAKMEHEADLQGIRDDLSKSYEAFNKLKRIPNPTQEDMAKMSRLEAHIKDTRTKALIIKDMFGKLKETAKELEKPTASWRETDAEGNVIAFQQFADGRTTKKNLGPVGKPLVGRTTGEDKTLKGLKGSYETFVKQYYAALKGTDIFTSSIKSERETVAKDSLRKAQELAIQYVKKGGDARDLGITPEGIREDFKAGTITKEKAMYLLKQLFGEAPK